MKRYIIGEILKETSNGIRQKIKCLLCKKTFYSLLMYVKDNYNKVYTICDKCSKSKNIR
jgi:translation initiation factor 2 beta subunit (eIF-2beta)/eIF-5